jgi:dCMP deaminase
MKEKYLQAFMKTAETFALLSTARRKKVGAIIVKDNRIISIGYNGTPSGWDNNCEDKIYTSPWQSEYMDEEGITYSLKTKPEVIHAEMNAIAKLAKSTESGDGSSMFITCAPCIECAKMIAQSGIKNAYYREAYRSDDGLEFLHKCNVSVERIDS